MVPPSLIVSDVGHTTIILNKPVIRLDCVNTNSNDYAVACKNDSSDCSNNSDCSILGMCCLAVGVTNNSIFWLLCNEVDFFTWWSPV